MLVLNNNADVGISTAGAGNTTIGNTTAGGAVQILANNNVTIDVAATTNNLTLNNIDDDNTTVHVLTLTGANSGNVRTQSLSDLVAADQGVQWNETGSDYEVRLGHATAGTGNQIVSSRFVNVGAGGTLTFRDAGTSTEMLVLNNNGNVQVNTSGTGTTTIGNTTNGGAVNVNSNSGITLTTTGAGQDVTLVSTDDVILNPGDQVTINTGAGSDLSITETTITRAGALTISTIGGGATNLSLSSSDDVVVTADNMTVNVTGGNLTLNTAATPDLVLTETLITRAASWTLSATGAGNDITITTADDLFLNPGDQVFVNTGGAADLSLTETTISRAGGLTIQTTGVGNDIELTAGSDIILTAAGGTPTVEVNTAGGANLVFSETTITRAGALSLTTTAGGDMTVNQAGNLILSNIATDNTVTSILGLNGSNQVRQTNLNAVAWLLGGNTLTGTQTIGSNTNHDVGIETNGTTRWTIPAAGGLTQNGTQQVTFNGNVDATSGLDVTGADLTVGGANFSVAPATGNTIIAGTLTANGNTTLGDADADDHSWCN